MSLEDWNLEASELEGERKAEDLAEERRYERIMSAERRHAEKRKKNVCDYTGEECVNCAKQLCTEYEEASP